MKQLLTLPYNSDEIESMRKDKSLTQHELTQILHISRVTYYKWLRDLEGISVRDYNRLIQAVSVAGEDEAR